MDHPKETESAAEAGMHSSFGARLRAFGEAAVRETKRNARLALLRARIAKLKLVDLNDARRQLGQECHRLNLIPDQLAAYRGAIARIEQRIADRRRGTPAAEGAGAPGKLQAAARNLAGKVAAEALALKLKRLFAELGAGLAELAADALPKAELERVEAAARKIGELEKCCGELSGDDLTGNAAAVPGPESPPVGGAGGSVRPANRRWLAAAVAAPAIITVLWLSLREGDRGAAGGPHAQARLPEPASLAPMAGAAPDRSPEVAKLAQRLLDEGATHFHAGDMGRAFSRFMEAAKMGHPGAQLQTGWHYEKGAGVRRDYEAAATWYRRAAEQGDATAMKNLGQLYENGQGMPEDWQLAAQWYRKGAEKNYKFAEAALGRAYQFGIGVPQDRVVSSYWNERALAHGDASCERWVRWLRDPTNNVGFRDEHEQALVMGNQLRTSGLLLGADPAGILFRNSTERIAWLRGLRNAVDQDEAESRRRIAEFDRQQAEHSRNRHESEVRQLQAQGYSREAAESKAGW